MEPLLKQIDTENGKVIAGLSYRVLQTLRSGRYESPIDKHELIAVITAPQRTKHNVADIIHVDYIKALNALEQLGLIDCERSENGSVITAVALRQPKPETESDNDANKLAFEEDDPRTPYRPYTPNFVIVENPKEAGPFQRTINRLRQRIRQLYSNKKGN